MNRVVLIWLPAIDEQLQFPSLAAAPGDLNLWKQAIANARQQAAHAIVSSILRSQELPCGAEMAEALLVIHGMVKSWAIDGSISLASGTRLTFRAIERTARLFMHRFMPSKSKVLSLEGLLSAVYEVYGVSIEGLQGKRFLVNKLQGKIGPYLASMKCNPPLGIDDAKSKEHQLALLQQSLAAVEEKVGQAALCLVNTVRATRAADPPARF